jgi:hypothetical protein
MRAKRLATVDGGDACDAAGDGGRRRACKAMEAAMRLATAVRARRAGDEGRRRCVPGGRAMEGGGDAG